MRAASLWTGAELGMSRGSHLFQMHLLTTYYVPGGVEPYRRNFFNPGAFHRGGDPSYKWKLVLSAVQRIK